MVWCSGLTPGGIQGTIQGAKESDLGWLCARLVPYLGTSALIPRRSCSYLPQFCCLYVIMNLIFQPVLHIICLRIRDHLSLLGGEGEDEATPGGAREWLGAGLMQGKQLNP